MSTDHLATLYVQLDELGQAAEQEAHANSTNEALQQYHKGAQAAYDKAKELVDSAILTTDQLDVDLQANCQKLSCIYQEFAAFLETMMPEIPSEARGFFSFLRDISQQSAALLSLIATEVRIGNTAASSEAIPDVEAAYEQMKRQLLTMPFFKGTVH